MKIAVGEDRAGWLSTHAISACREHAEAEKIRSTDTLLIFFTSGTTGLPKMVVHTHASYPIGHLSTMYWLGLRPGDVHLNVSSPGWAKHAWSCVFAPWIAEATLAVDWAALDPSPDELAKLKAAGFSIEEVDPANFHKKELYVRKVTLLPFYWGFDLGRVVSTDEMYKMLTVIEAHADELAKLDPSFRQISGGHMAAFEKQALESTWNLVPIHPGLAQYMKARGVGDSKWDANVAQ